MTEREFLLALDYTPVGGDYWIDPGGHYVYVDTALDDEGWPEAAIEMEGENG
jgi:hypothetical protein